MKKMLIIFSVVIFIIANVGIAQDIINETGKDGKFIVRDNEQKEVLIIEDGNVAITGELSVESMPEGSSSSPYVVWDTEDKKFKTVARVFSKLSPLSEPLDTRSWHSIGYGEVDEDGNEISASVLGTAATTWNTFITDYGYIKLGPANTKGGHIYTDMSKFIFNKKVFVTTGEFGAHASADLIFKTGAKTRLIFKNSTGNVGIGTTNPATNLHIAGDMRLDDASPYLLFFSGATNKGSIGIWTDGNLNIINKVATGKTVFATNSLERMRITDDGKVGIGTAFPQGKLDIVSDDGALIVPRMTTTQRNNLPTVNGSIIYNTTDNEFNFYENGSWMTK